MKKYIETTKTVAIAMLVAGILSFVAGVHYANQANAKTINTLSKIQVSK